LVWQLNDCWPVTSWSIVDYYLRKKPAFYTMKRALAPITISVGREHHDWSTTHAHPPGRLGYEVWVSSNRTEAVEADVELRYISIETGYASRTTAHITVAANGTTEFFRERIDVEEEEPHVLAARLWVGSELVSWDCDWPQPLKYLDFSDRGVEVVV